MTQVPRDDARLKALFKTSCAIGSRRPWRILPWPAPSRKAGARKK